MLKTRERKRGRKEGGREEKAGGKGMEATRKEGGSGWKREERGWKARRKAGGKEKG